MHDLWDEVFSRYTIRGVNLLSVRNKNELRVIDAMQELLDGYPSYTPDHLDLQDIYALSLNNLTPRYRQQGTIIIHEIVSWEEILETVRNAIDAVRMEPRYK